MNSDLCLSLRERQIIFGLFLIPKFGLKRTALLFKHFPNWERIWNLKYSDLQQINFPPRLIQLFLYHRQKLDLVAEWEKHQQANIQIITYYHPLYPSLLKQIFSPPLVLLAQGNTQLLTKLKLLSVIGSRTPNSYSQQVIQQLIPPLAQQGLTIVSGLAPGIDSLAHQAALNTLGSTLAVLATPLNKVYPPENKDLQQQIKQQGLLISEFPLNTSLKKQNFALRNRIIAGLSPATLVIQANLPSGALFTAESALQENREVLTIPGSILDDNFQGNHRLIQQGAKIITSQTDILEIYSSRDN